ncbi:MAG: hypothetical protein ABIG11_05960 [bacterium]
MKILPLNHAGILKELGRYACSVGSSFWAVGGCVRDWKLGLKNKDLDLVSTQYPASIAAYCVEKWGGELEKFDRFGTCRVFLDNGLRLDFVRARREKYPKPAVLPEVSPGSFRDDLARRDFSVNAIAVDLQPDNFGEVADIHGGLADIEKRSLRILHEKSFRDDPTRLYRLARFAGRFGWKPDGTTLGLVREAVAKGYPALLSRERLKNELWRVLEERYPVPALMLMKKWDILKFIHPALRCNYGISASAEPAARLGIIAAGMKDDGRHFLESLQLERSLCLQLKNAFGILRNKACSKTRLSGLEKEIIVNSLKNLPACSLKPLFLNGSDLKKAGIPPGRKYSLILDDAARAQWKEEFFSRQSALVWLKKRLSGTLRRAAGTAARLRRNISASSFAYRRRK